MGKKWMWKFAYPERPERDRTCCACRPDRPVRLLITSRDVIHSFFVPEFRIKQDVLPGPLHADLVRGHQAGALPDALRRVLRHLATRDAGRGGGACRRRSSTRGWREQRSGPAGRPQSTRGGDDGRRVRAARSSSRASRSRWPRGLPQVPHRRRHAAHRPDLARPLPARRRSSQDGETVDRRRGLPDRVDDGPAARSRGGLPAGDADLPGAARRRRRLPPLVEYIKSLRTPRSAPAPSKGAVYEPSRSQLAPSAR